MKVNFEVFNKLAGIVSCMLVLLTMTSCLDDEDGVDPTPVAYVSIFHASPDAPDLDVVLDDQPILNQPLEYTDYTNYLQFYTGNRELAFNAFNASNILTDTTYNFQANTAYSVFVTDEVANLSTLIVEDNAEEPATDKALIRFIPLSPDAPAVDFLVGEEDSLLFSNRQFKQATDFTEINADSYALTVTATGDDESLVSVPETELKPGGIYTVITRGFIDPPSGNSNGLNIQIIQNQ